jgi:hypothetical protein
MSLASTNILDDIFPTAAIAAIARKGKHLVIHLALKKPSRRSLASSGPVVHSLPSYCLFYIFLMGPLKTFPPMQHEHHWTTEQCGTGR